MAFFSKVRGVLQHKITNSMGREISASTPFIFQAIRCMSSKLFVGGLSYQTNEETLQQTFEKYGQVYEARIILDRQTGNSRGFGFITFETTEAANSAIMALDGQELEGRRLKVNHAHDKGQGYGGGRGYNNPGSNFGCGGGYNYSGGNYPGGGQGNYVGGDYQGGGYGNYSGGNYQAGGGYGNYSGGNYQAGGGDNNYSGQGDQGNYSNNPGVDGGYSATGGGSYDSHHVSGGGDYVGAGGNYPSTGGNLDSGSNVTSTNVGYGGASNQPFGVPGGGAGSDNYNGSINVSDNTSVGYKNTTGLSYEDGDHQFSKNVNSDMAYDDEPEGYQDRRAS